ncbi:MAG: OmpH family outer membrane protein [Deltaproteobacteria bacterium]|nr:OmpH family outer membrane protein [Deltaproteobacteria bacterium]MBW1929060.1 OmpH family outer membrane protein [Deltaproteobacteria bacterium]
MKKILLLILTVMFLGVGQTFAADQVCKIGLIDMEKFQQKSVAFQRIKLKLERKFENLKKKLDAEKKEVMKLEEELKKQSLMLSLDAKEDKRRELERKKRYYKYLYNEFSQEMKEAEQDAKRMVGKEIEKIVEKIGKTQGYTIILERRTLGLVYYKDSIDITDQVVAAYDKMKGSTK